MTRRFTIAAIVLVLMAGIFLLAASARNEYCLPWQERVGHGDGPLRPGQDFSACR